MMNKYNLFLGNSEKPCFIMQKGDHMIVRKNNPAGDFNPRSSSTIKRDIYSDSTDDFDDDSNDDGEKNNKFFFKEE
ncbi:Uncharacterized protein PCOAH_00027840 [Plasmodium coatneyi]|uniref:Uncharacterized protein n=1 Tax=Plasmodium coatneyi TaxID=208452 RepID=A0A1B1E059_9APIC|nr:Uncharacterized protein PCOAH_00027840 [Plasmodium coatneyi]ANQ08414.1 Uncharacterized protein PCOAH_00027840 [Plasmodium coatneyi]